MNYRHAFHAGNFADVHKHLLLVALLERLHRKPTPIFYLDTHAGSGLYDLNGSEAQRGAEAANGIGRLLEREPQNAEIARYLLSVRAYLDAPPGRSGRHYPGSPLIALDLLRSTDRAVFVEREPREYEKLREHVGKRKLTSILCDDGYKSLKAHLPPKENRGLVLLDPPYENDTEFADLTRGLQFAAERWPTGMFAAWYPIKAGQADAHFLAKVKESGLKKVLVCEICVRPRDALLGLNGSGMVIVNAPWKFDEALQPALEQLFASLSPQGGETRLDWLVGEN